MKCVKRWISVMLAAALLVSSIVLAVGTSNVSYTVSLGSGSSVIEPGGTVSVCVLLSATGTDVYNTYHVICSYDEAVLHFESAEFADGSTPDRASAANGVLTVAGYGADRAVSNYLYLHFKVIGSGSTTVTLAEAKYDISKNAVSSDMRSATISDGEGSVTFQAGGYAVTLPDTVTGDAYVAKDVSYTFAVKNAGYIYTFAATVNGSTVSVIDNGDGTYTVKNVTGALVITQTDAPVPRTYSVTVTGSGAEAVTAAATATYGSDFTFTLKEANHYTYTVTVTANGETLTPSATGGTYTISGEAILGDIVIAVERAQKEGYTHILYTGSGAEDVPVKNREGFCKNNEEYGFLIEKVDGYDYAVTVKWGNTNITNKVTAKGDVYTIPAAYMTGTDITVTITKTARVSVAVEAKDYVTQSGGTSVFLVLAKPAAALEEGKGLYYDSSPMYWSEKYGGFVWLVSGSGNAEAVKAAAEECITIGMAAHTTVSYGGDVNNTGRTDMNDVQLVYDMYNMRVSFSSDMMEKFLRADLNGDGKLDVLDAQAVLNIVLGEE